MKDGAGATGPAVHTFVIADVRGYTRFTREHGDAAAASLAKRLADLARDAIEARRGRVIELRGDEVLAVFDSTPQAVRAAVELQAMCVEDTAADPALPLTVGIGIDAGEAVPVEDGFRGVALNTAARLCSRALAGQILVTRAVADAAEGVDGVALEEVGPAELKGFETPVDVIAVVSTRAPLADLRRVPPTELPPELDPVMPLVGREGEVHWLRGTWRQARRGRGRVVFVSGPSQIGKTRLVAELAAEVADGGGDVVYAGTGGAALAMTLGAVHRAAAATEATLVVLDDLDVVGEEAASALADAHDAIADRPAMVVATVKDPAAGPALASAVQLADRSGDGHASVPAFALDGARGIARLYVGEDVEHLPLESMVRASGGLPGRLHEVVSEWTRDEAGRRLAAAAEWLAQGRDRRSADLEFANNAIGLGLARLYAGEPSAAAGAECPYKGLASFEESDAASFFGRERLVGELAARTVHVGLLGVVGASGSGKSSLLAGGLFPSLSAGLLPGSKRWRTVRFRPGDHPMAELQHAVGGTLDDAIGTTDPDGRLVLAVDQFEEVFTLSAEEEREAFIATLADAAATSPDRFVAVLTIRDDFYGRCAPYRELAELLVANHVLVPPMTDAELRRAIELPARRAHLRVEGDLVDALAAEVVDEPGGLPLLSAALVELWQAREDGWLRMAAYERTGGVRGAVARLAEAAHERLTAEERESARRLFLRLASVGEGDVVTRRRVPLSELELDTDPSTAAVVERLTADRLLTATGSTVEVAHEALLREWPRLGAWLEEDLQGQRLRQHLTQAARQWDAADREPSELYRGARPSAALDWASTHGTDLNELERTFLADSRQTSERVAERQRRTNRRLRGLLVGTAAFLVIALVAGGLALVQRGRARSQAGRAETEAVRAEREARIATARELASASVANLDVDPERSILLALHAVDATWMVDHSALPEAQEALHRALEESRVFRTVPQGGGVAVSADGSRFATTGEEGSPTVWETDTGERLFTLEGHDGAVNGVAFSPDGSVVATAGSDRTVRLWDGATGRQIRVLRGHRGAVLCPQFSPDGTLLATSSADATVRIWDVSTGRERMVLRGPAGPFDPSGTVLRPAFSPDGSRLIGGGWPTAPIWDLTTGKIAILLTQPTFDTRVAAVAFSPDGTRVATGIDKGITQTWDAETGKLLASLPANAPVSTVAYSREGDRLATAGNDGLAHVWDAATGEQLLTLAGHTVGIQEVTFTPDGDRLLTGGLDGTARLWDIGRTGLRDGVVVPGPALRFVNGGVAFSPDGRSFAVPDQLRGVTIRDVDTGRKLMTLKGPDAAISAVVFSPDGTRLAAASAGQIGTPEAVRLVPIWDVATGDLVMTLHADGWVAGLAFSPDGRRLATSGQAGTVQLWDAGNGTELRSADAGGQAFALAFSPDGRWLVSGQDGENALRVWDADSLEPRGELRGHTDLIQHVTFGRDGKVVTASFDGTAKIWDLATRRELATLRGHSGPIMGVAVSPDGEVIATGSVDATAKLWDAETGSDLLTLFGHTRIVMSVAFSPDGRLLATQSGDGTVVLHVLPIDDLRKLALERVTRGLTDEECRQYLHVPNCAAG